MSLQPSIPASLPPGKDPPSSTPSTAITALHSVTNQSPKPRDINPHTNTKSPSPELSHKASTAEADMKAMIMPPPPPTPASNTPRPVMGTAQPPSSSSPTLTRSTSQNTASQDQSEAEAEAETEKDRLPFTPFFTLINDLSTGDASTHHPSQVHYIFADDDINEVLTGALVRAIEGDGDIEQGALQDAEDETSSSSSSSSSSATFGRDGTRIRRERPRLKYQNKYRQRTQTRDTTREERVIIVDVNEAGDAVTGVSSVAPSWQVLSAEIGKAPTWDKDVDGAEGERGEMVGGLMLKIEGVGVGNGGKGKGRERDGEAVSSSAVVEEDMQALMEAFDRKMGLLRRVVQRGSRESLVKGEES